MAGRLWDIFKLLLTLSHGQATIERGFSQNKDIMCDNLAERTLVAQHVIIDHINYVGGLGKVKVSKQMLLSAPTARNKYQMYLDKEKKKRKETENHERKAIDAELQDVNLKKPFLKKTLML